jgi:hypothetical protein
MILYAYFKLKLTLSKEVKNGLSDFLYAGIVIELLFIVWLAIWGLKKLMAQPGLRAKRRCGKKKLRRR